MFTAVVSAAFEHVEKPLEIGIAVGLWIGQRITNARLGCQMHDKWKTLSLEQCSRGAAISKIELYKPKRGKFGQFSATGPLQVDVIIGIQAVDTDDRTPIFEQPPRHMKSNEPGGPCNQNHVLHDGSLAALAHGSPKEQINSPSDDTFSDFSGHQCRQSWKAYKTRSDVISPGP